MRPREFITLLGGASAWPLGAHAQQPGIAVVGHLDSGARAEPKYDTALRQGLREMGYVEGENVRIEYRGSEDNNELPRLAAELVQRQVSVILTSSNSNASRAAFAATTRIPIVLAHGA